MPRTGRTRSCRGRAARRRRLALSLLVAAGSGPVGCALNRAAQRELAAELGRYQRMGQAQAEDYGRSATPAAATQPAATRPAGQPAGAAASPRTLRDYILLALRRNPQVKAAEQSARARAARVAQVTALPDPRLITKTLPEPVRTAEGDNYFILGIQQKFPVPEKLDRAGRVALQELRMALQELQRTRLRVIADVKRAYYRLYVIDRTTEIDQANQDLLRGLIEAVRAQVAAGRRSQGDVLRAEVELSNLESKLIDLRQQRKTVVAALNRLLDRAPATPVAEAQPFGLRRAELRLGQLLGLAAERNPELRRLKEQIERDRQGVALARLAYWPDFTLGLEWMAMDARGAFEPLPNPQTGMRPPVPQLSEAGSDNWAIVLSLNIPLWFQKIEAGIREARRRLLASQQQYVAARNRVNFELADALARVRSQRELAQLFGNTIIPLAQQTYEVSRAAYMSGTTDFLFVIDNWQKWLTFSIQYHRALGELERSVADLEEALGLSLGRTGGS